MKISGLISIKRQVILASQSPRRRQLLTQIGLEFSTQPSSFDEDSIQANTSPEEYVQKLAIAKAADIASRLKEKHLVIGADTTVVLNNEILNKPTNKQQAIKMLEKLSGKTHTVFTGIALVAAPEGIKISAVQKTDVTFRTLQPDEIKLYVESGSPMDKAGAYGIQDDFGAVFVEHINGCYYNIVGLPLEMLYRKLRALTTLLND
ncbi:MAG TPA: nucleoside triphosphate pyrophosphatase [Candidatus Kapabacteria bacterium]|jgi:septum formation protein|nr:septum formation protein Maf [Ignavibacteria bacterium]HRE56273.1 nucleoside triphosphate pyrophosphatase [Candidatus Kapabacteria bacterium]HRK59529.1 nucleoside triphosphate pyrophosphatase [Candidatus Kapabacteria bacterium]